MASRLVVASNLRQASIPVLYCRLASTATARKPAPKPASAPAPAPPPASPAPQPSSPSSPQLPPYKQSLFTQYLIRNPAAKRIFLKFMGGLGYGSPKQIAGRRAWFMYESVCAPRAGEEKDFWQSECHLPPTFQSWFTVTNLHVWMLTVRLRALPDPHGKHYIQALIDHFFYDVEDRIRAVLQPTVRPQPRLPPPAVGGGDGETFPGPQPTFYTLPNRDNLPKGNAPERLVTRQMKIMKEQWAGMGLSFDAALVRGDMDMAASVWRNLLGARGARGIVYPSSPLAGTPDKPYFRRSINLVGGEVEKLADVEKKGLDAEEARDDGSGVHDYAPSEAGRYVLYPELMADITAYCRREIVRMEALPDDVVMGKNGEDVDVLKFGPVRP